MPLQSSAAPAAPGSAREIFVAFTLLALQGFGGVLAVAQRELVERRRWLTQKEFIEDWAVAQILPGPNVVNLSLMIGSRHFGLRGAVAGLLGMFTVPLALLLAISLIYAGFAEVPAAQGALRGMGAVAAGLIGATGVKLMAALGGNPMGRLVCALLACATFVAVAWLRLPLIYLLLTLGLAACAWAYLSLARAERQGETEP